MSIQLSEAAPADRRTWVRRGLVLLGLAVGVVLAGVLLSGPAHADTGSGHDLLSGGTAQPESPHQPDGALGSVTQRTRETANTVTRHATAAVRTTARAVDHAARPAVRPTPSATAPSRSAAPDSTRSTTHVARHVEAPSVDTSGRQAAQAPRTSTVPHRSPTTHATEASLPRLDVPATVRDTATHATRAVITLTDRTTGTLRTVTDAVAPALSPVVHGAGATVDGLARHLDTTVQRTTRVLEAGTARVEDRPAPAGQAPRASGASTVREPHTLAHDATRTALGSKHSAVRPAEPTSVPTTSTIGAPSENGPAETLDSTPHPLPAQPSHGDPIGACATSSGGSSSFHGAAPAALLSGAAVHDGRTVSTHPGYDHPRLGGPSFDPGSSPD